MMFFRIVWSALLVLTTLSATTDRISAVFPLAC